MHSLLSRLQRVRTSSLEMVSELQSEDFRVQTITEVSPPWWNLGHTSWFFAKNLLEPEGLGLAEDKPYEYVLNSYYNCHGQRVAQADRGKLSRPTTKEILRYRESVDKRLNELFGDGTSTTSQEKLKKWKTVVEAGIQHEQQHQELFYSEIKHIWANNPVDFRPFFSEDTGIQENNSIPHSRWIDFRGGQFHLGATATDHWCWDNELGGQDVIIDSFQIGSQLVTCAEYLEFMDDGGYEKPEFWLDNGWAAVQKLKWKAPLYWEKDQNRNWQIYTLHGMKKLIPNEPVCHVSFYEADAFARWQGARLPLEEEWEFVAKSIDNNHSGNFVESDFLHPQINCENSDFPSQLMGDVWEWTASAYRPYRSYKPFQGNLTEYNGKFMDGQYVLRGGSCFTPSDHIRPTYRNFWYPLTRFQMSGIRTVKIS